MPTIEAIRRIRIEQVSTGGEAVRRDLQATANAQQQIGTAAEAAAIVTETAARRQLSAASSYQRLREQVDQTARSATAYQRAMSIMDRASAQGVAGATDLARTLSLIESRYGAAAVEARAFEEATRRAAAAQRQAWSGLGSQGAKMLDNIEASRRLGSLGSNGEGQAANENRRLRADQVQNLAYQAGDIVSSLGSGSNLSTVAFQQGPQIAQVFGGPGGASLKGAFTQASEAASGFTTRIGVVGGAFGLLTTAAAAAIAAEQSYASTQTVLAQQLSGVGRAAGVTAGQINAIAPAAAAAGGVSVRQAREMAGEFAATGKIGEAMFTGLIGSVRDYAATTGQQVPDATKALADAFADPAKGADALDRQLAILNDTTRENIQRLAAQGDRLGAQRVLMDAYRSGLTSATELTSGWARVTAAAGNVVSNVWDRVGKAVDHVATGGDLETRIRDLQRVLADGPQQQSGILGLLGVGAQRAPLQAELDKLLAEQQRRQASSAQAEQNRRSVEVGNLVRGYNPAAEQLKKLEDSATRIRTDLAILPFDQQGEARRTMDGLTASAKLLREDLQAGGTQFADAIRSAQFGLRTVGFTQQGRGAAEINQRAETDIRAAQLNANDPLYRDYQVNSIKERQRLELATLRQQSTLSENTTGGAFSRLSASVQQQVTAAAEQYGRIPAAIIAAVAEKESSGNPNIGPTRVLNAQGLPSTSAYGLGQITTGTARDAVRGGYLPPGFDRTDPAQGAAGIAGVLSMKLDQAGGDLAKALQNYYGSRDPGANQAYAADVLRRAGQMGDASTLGQVREADANARALQTANDNLRLNTELYGRNGLALEAQTTANRMLSDQLARGVPLTDALRASVDAFATGSATAAQKLKLVQFGADTTFDREQLGRDRYDQSAFARARSTVGDTTSPAALAVIDQSRQNQYLTDARSTLTDAATGFATALSHGTSAASAFSNALSRIGDKLIGGVLDSLVGSAFKSGGLLSLFGFADGGMITGPGGPREDRVLARLSPGEYVVNAAATSRHFDLIHAINTGRLPGYAQGGLFTSPTPEVGEEGAYDVRIAT
ncbi:phage tail length tape measure family protein [Methylobacterium radiotolerans]|uniref:phage tail length tape measure family protein n=1 Tax=Methylobacterium radiotolerans TaxID=31998 RepID=UPI000E31DF01|nr:MULTISPECIES: phage tail length tape measure family protein [Methylobacterium]MDE3748617.1 phage tail length tape measure family protein [Methylobacterium radiotolerans]